MENIGGGSEADRSGANGGIGRGGAGRVPRGLAEASDGRQRDTAELRPRDSVLLVSRRAPQNHLYGQCRGKPARAPV